MMVMFLLMLVLLLAVGGLSHAEAEDANASLVFDVVIGPNMPNMTFSVTKTGQRDEDGIDYNLYDLVISETADPSKVVQTISFSSIMAPEPELVTLIDLNFDGIYDLDITYDRAVSNVLHIFYLWDTQSGQYVEKTLGNLELGNYTQYPEAQIIHSYEQDSAATGTDSIYQWQNGELVLLRRLETNVSTEGDKYFVRLVDFSNGAETVLIDEKDLDADTYLNGFESRDTALWDGITQGTIEESGNG